MSGVQILLPVQIKRKNMAHYYDDGPDIKATNERIQKKQAEIEKLEKEKPKVGSSSLSMPAKIGFILDYSLINLLY